MAHTFHRQSCLYSAPPMVASVEKYSHLYKYLLTPKIKIGITKFFSPIYYIFPYKSCA